GLYHNHHEIKKDIIHLSSLKQATFGEDEKKRITVLNDDQSYEIIIGQVKRFTKVVMNVDEISTKEIKELIKTHKNSQDVVRFEFTGEESKLKAINKSQFEDTGIDIKIKYEAKYDLDSKNLKLPAVTEYYGKDEVK